MAYAGISTLEDGIQQRLRGMLSRTDTIQSYLNRNLLRQFQQAQMKRWMTENDSEGGKWKPLTPKYAKYKRRKFSSAPGGGNALMVATGRLASGAQARDSSYFYKIVTNSSFTLGINLSALPYAAYPGRTRPYMQFSKETLRQFKQGILDYLAHGEGG